MDKIIVENKSDQSHDEVFKRLAYMLKEDLYAEPSMLESEGIATWEDGFAASVVNNKNSHRIVYYEEET